MAGAVALGLFSLYAVLYWAWVTATPLTESQLARAQYNATAWCWLLVGSAVAATVLLFCWLRSCRSDGN